MTKLKLKLNARWVRQLYTIELAGYQAFWQSQPMRSCPYERGCHTSKGAGGGLQQQRRRAWYRGWLQANEEKQNATRTR